MASHAKEINPAANVTGRSVAPRGPRLARDQLWDAEVRRQAAEAGLVTITVDGGQNIQDLGQRLARMFLLDQQP